VSRSFEISQYITKHFALDAAAQKAGGEPGQGLKVAGSNGERRQEDGIGIVLTTDKDEETVRREREEEAAAKRQQNIMPAWHLKSTISGDLTALGIKENAQNTTAQVPGQTSVDLDESLKGLGRVVRPSPLKAQIDLEADEDVKPDVKASNEADCGSSHMKSGLRAYLFFRPRLRPVLRVFGSLDRTLDAAHALGRVFRARRL
jgi:transcription initiation factor TFIIE subunit alpha